MMCLKRAEKKKLLVGHNGCLITFKKIQKQPAKVFYKKAVLLKT